MRGSNTDRVIQQGLMVLIFFMCSSVLFAEGFGSLSGKVNRIPSTGSESRVTRYTGQQVVPADHHSEHSIANPGQAVVYLVPENKISVEPIKPNPTIEQRDLQFQPRLLAITVGTSVDFPNSDPVFHNVFSYSRTKTFDLGRYRQGRSKSVEFDKPGLVKVFCEIHNTMQAFVLVLDTPYFTLSDEAMGYSFENIPAGKYELVLWQEQLPELRKSIEIRANENLELNLP